MHNYTHRLPRKLEHYTPKQFTGGGGTADLINLGNTLIVSKTGDDARAAAESLNNHYLTIAAALAAAKTGDVVLVFAGTYTESLTISTAGLGIVLFNASIVGNLQVNSENVSIRYADFSVNASTANIRVGDTGVVGSCWIYGSKIANSLGSGVQVINGVCTIYDTEIAVSFDYCIEVGSEGSLKCSSSKMVAENGVAMDLAGNFDISGCYIEGNDVATSAVDVRQLGAGLSYQQIKASTIKAPSGAVGSSTGLIHNKILLDGIVTNATLISGVNVIEGYNTQGVDLV